MEYLVIISTSWNGHIVSRYEEKDEAESDYQDAVREVQIGYLYGVTLIEGTIIKEEKDSI